METDTSFTEVDLKPEKIEDVKEEGEKFHCELSDKEMVHKLALVLLEGLSTACIDNTTGDMFKSPGTVAADIRKEMLDYLTERSESFVAESVILEGGQEEEKSDNPYDIISDFIDDFTGLKRNLFSRVSGWLLSEMREDKIDDFVQELQLNSFWSLDRREAIAHVLLKNVDFKNELHCNMKFKSVEELEQHRAQCGFRTVTCENQGCNVSFSAAHLEKHDSICPFKLLPCEQKCPEILIRREMDRHCITVCPMKLVNCPFYSIGCQASVPSCNIKEHCTNDVRSHLLYALQYLHKGASADDLKPRVEQIEQESSGQLAGMQGVRSFTNAVKNLDVKLGPFKVENKHVDKGEDGKTKDSEYPPLEQTTTPREIPPQPTTPPTSKELPPEESPPPPPPTSTPTPTPTPTPTLTPTPTPTPSEIPPQPTTPPTSKEPTREQTTSPPSVISPPPPTAPPTSSEIPPQPTIAPTSKEPSLEQTTIPPSVIPLPTTTPTPSEIPPQSTPPPTPKEPSPEQTTAPPSREISPSPPPPTTTPTPSEISPKQTGS